MMRPLSSLNLPRKASGRRDSDAQRRGAQQQRPSASETNDKPVRKRCLNEAAHKLDR